MADKKTSKYHFLDGKNPVTKEFDSDAEAIAFGKTIKGLLRIQNDTTGKHVWENPNPPEADEVAADPKAGKGTKADKE